MRYYDVCDADNVRDITVAGKIMLPFFTALCGSAVKLSMSWYLIAMPEINIYGSAISSNAAYILVMILNLIAIHKCLV
mgnify:CR=1 FL=1